MLVNDMSVSIKKLSIWRIVTLMRHAHHAAIPKSEDGIWELHHQRHSYLAALGEPELSWRNDSLSVA